MELLYSEQLDTDKESTSLIILFTRKSEDLIQGKATSLPQIANALSEDLRQFGG